MGAMKSIVSIHCLSITIILIPFTALVTSLQMPQAHDSTTPQDKSDILQCPACLKFFSSGKGLNSHLSMARSCQWYWKGKNRELVDFTDQ